MTLSFEESADDGGSRVTAYELWMSADHQSASPTFALVAGYSDSAMGYTLTAAVDGLVSGSTYAFRTIATNSKGSSEPSLELVVAVAQPIAKPAAPTRRLSLSIRTSLYIEWEEAAATEIEVQGYLLYMAEGLGGDYRLV